MGAFYLIPSQNLQRASGAPPASKRRGPVSREEGSKKRGMME